MCHHTKLGHLHDREPGFCAPLASMYLYSASTNTTNSNDLSGATTRAHTCMNPVLITLLYRFTNTNRYRKTVHM